MKENEWISNCCDAPPETELEYKEEFDAEPIGRCSKCKEGAIFYLNPDFY
tara:strand:+ start:11299 stop:11448 length:150 start_codon:yes stop_codon:yes gene_type:complete